MQAIGYVCGGEGGEHMKLIVKHSRFVDYFDLVLRD